MSADIDRQSLKLHVDIRGDVWYCAGDKPPVNSDHDWQDIQLDWHRWPRIRMLGTRRHALLLCKLYELHKTGDVKQLDVASPAVACVAAGCCDPDPPEVLYRMRQCAWPRSLGGWHAFSAADAVTYYLAGHFASWTPCGILHALRSHVLWPALGFPAGLELQACAELISLILDPRWYVNLQRPDRLGRLESYLGLNPRIQRVVTDYQQRGESLQNLSSYHRRCDLVRRCWSRELPPGDATAPNQFLWRIWAKASQTYLGELRAGQKLVAYLRHNWLDRLMAIEGGREPLFDADLFFLAGSEVEAYNGHMASQPA